MTLQEWIELCECTQDKDEFLRYRYTTVHHHQIIAVLVLNTQRHMMIAYIGTVPGHCHSKEWMEVRRYGDELPEPFAKLLFPEYFGCSEVLYGEE